MKTLVGIVIIATSCGYHSFAEDPESTNAIETNVSISELIKIQKDGRISILGKLISNGANDSSLKTFLINYYHSLPKNPERRDAIHKINSYEDDRILILKYIFQNNPPDDFIADAVKEEADYLAWAEEKKHGLSRDIPSRVRTLILENIKEKHLDSPKIRTAVKNAAENKSIIFFNRQEFTALSIAFEMHEQRINEIKDKVKFIADRLNPIPVPYTPWEIQRDKEKRIAYGQTEETKAKWAESAKIIRSDEGIYEQGLEMAFVQLGREAAEPTIELVEKNTYYKPVNDLLMQLAAQIIFNYGKITKGILSEADILTISKIKKYSDDMENLGAGDAKSRVDCWLTPMEQMIQKRE